MDRVPLTLSFPCLRPYFGCNAAGQVVDLSEMTYAEVLLRMVQLMYVDAEKQVKLNAAADASGQELPYARPPPGAGRWLDPTFCSRVQLFALRAEERCLTLPPGSMDSQTKPSVVFSASLMSSDPAAAVENV